MRSEAKTVQAYLAQLPEERREAVSAVRDLVNAYLPSGYRETMAWGMITWEVPLEASGPTYNGKPLMYAALASQKRHIALYLCGANCVPELEAGLREAYARAGRKLDMGKACLRFRSLGEVDREAVAACIAALPVEDFIAAGRKSG